MRYERLRAFFEDLQSKKIKTPLDEEPESDVITSWYVNAVASLFSMVGEYKASPSDVLAFLEMYGNIGTPSQFVECMHTAAAVYEKLSKEQKAKKPK